MHSEIIRIDRSLIDLTMYDDDELDLIAEVSKLMDMLNDHGTVNQIDAMEICKQRNWPVHKEYDPCHYYSNDEGYSYWFDMANCNAH